VTRKFPQTASVKVSHSRGGEGAVVFSFSGVVPAHADPLAYRPPSHMVHSSPTMSPKSSGDRARREKNPRARMGLCHQETLLRLLWPFHFSNSLQYLWWGTRGRRRALCRIFQRVKSDSRVNRELAGHSLPRRSRCPRPLEGKIGVRSALLKI
jgi:hypothetical protein